MMLDSQVGLVIRWMEGGRSCERMFNCSATVGYRWRAGNFPRLMHVFDLLQEDSCYLGKLIVLYMRKE